MLEKNMNSGSKLLLLFLNINVIDLIYFLLQLNLCLFLKYFNIDSFISF